VVSQAVKALCDLEVLLRKGIEQPDGSWQPWFDHPPVPDGGWPFKWCSDEAEGGHHGTIGAPHKAGGHRVHPGGPGADPHQHPSCRDSGNGGIHRRPGHGGCAPLVACAVHQDRVQLQEPTTLKARGPIQGPPWPGRPRRWSRVAGPRDVAARSRLQGSTGRRLPRSSSLGSEDGCTEPPPRSTLHTG
jgi:hypothetical protein